MSSQHSELFETIRAGLRDNEAEYGVYPGSLEALARIEEQYGTARDLVSAFVREAENAGWFEDMDEWGREDWGLIDVKGGTMLDAKAFLDGVSNPAKEHQ